MARGLTCQTFELGSYLPGDKLIAGLIMMKLYTDKIFTIVLKGASFVSTTLGFYGPFWTYVVLNHGTLVSSISGIGTR